MFNSSGEVSYSYPFQLFFLPAATFLFLCLVGQEYFKMSFQTVMYSSTLKRRNLQINNVKFMQVNDQEHINVSNHAKLPWRLNNQKVILLSTPRRETQECVEGVEVTCSVVCDVIHYTFLENNRRLSCQ